MSISAKDVKRLRDMTGVGMMDCKQALQEADGDFDRAVEILRKKGQKVAAKRADREANEGLVVTAISADNKAAAMAEVNCETDFVARNDDFGTYANEIATLILREKPADMESLRDLAFVGGRSVADSLLDMTGKIGEKIDVRRFVVVEAGADGAIVSYTHPGSRLGVLVEVSGSGDLQAVGVDVAMQAAALSPIATSREEVPAEIQEKEMDIAREAARNEGKPENILDRIAQGKLERFFKDNVLLEQPFVKDSSISVGDMVKKAGVQVHRFVRYSLGD
ncbi:MAG: translation elongation factor Ts [Rhodothermales bacterium]